MARETKEETMRKPATYEYSVYLNGRDLARQKSADVKLDGEGQFRQALVQAFPEWGIAGEHESPEEEKKALDSGEVVATVSFHDFVCDDLPRKTYTVKKRS